MNTSEQINELAAALSKAQGKIVGALKDSANPFFKSKYADLASCWDACREQLSSNGLAVIQGVGTGTGANVSITTRLVHASGQWVEETLYVHPKDDSPQAAGSAITYGRRYALAAIVGLAQIDDDAEAAMGRSKPNVISPVDEITKNLTAVEKQQAETTAKQMREILSRDVFDEEKCLAVADLNDLLGTQHELSTQAWKLLQTADRTYWKKLVAMAHEKERAEPRFNGR